MPKNANNRGLKLHGVDIPQTMHRDVQIMSAINAQHKLPNCVYIAKDASSS